MAQTELSLKSGGFSFETTFDDGDAAARQQALDTVLFILGNRGGETVAPPRRRRRRADSDPTSGDREAS